MLKGRTQIELTHQPR